MLWRKIQQGGKGDNNSGDESTAVLYMMVRESLSEATLSQARGAPSWVAPVSCPCEYPGEDIPDRGKSLCQGLEELPFIDHKSNLG